MHDRRCDSREAEAIRNRKSGAAGKRGRKSIIALMIGPKFKSNLREEQRAVAPILVDVQCRAIGENLRDIVGCTGVVERST